MSDFLKTSERDTLLKIAIILIKMQSENPHYKIPDDTGLLWENIAFNYSKNLKNSDPSSLKFYNEVFDVLFQAKSVIAFGDEYQNLDTWKNREFKFLLEED